MDRKIMETLYLRQGLSQSAVASELGCSTTNVRYWLQKHGIKRNRKHKYDGVSEKTCPQCKTAKKASQFYKRRKDGWPGSWCKTCMKAQVIERQRKHKAEAVRYKGGCCLSCYFDLHLGALEFHHLDPSKKDSSISKITRSPLTLSGRQELDKCVLLCANCHRMAHAGLVTFDQEGNLLTSPCKG